MLVKIAKQVLGSHKRILSIVVSISNNKANNPFNNIFFGGGSSQSPSIVNVSIVANAFASTSNLFKSVKFCCGFVVDWFVID
jgi:hypothetical protein